MKLREIKIRGYKSIEDLEFPVQKYGTGDNESYTTILIGKNETGKSNVLDAMAIPQYKGKVAFDKIQNQQKEPEIVAVVFDFEVESADDYRAAIGKAITIPDELVDSLDITKISKEIYLQGTMDEYGIDAAYEAAAISVKKYSFIEIEAKPAIPPKPAQEEAAIIKLTSELTDEEKETYSQLTNDKFKEIIKSALWNFVDDLSIPVDYWTYEEKYLVEGKVNLKTFAGTPDINIPLKNMFYLAGYKNQQEIKTKVDEIEKSDNKRKKLEKEINTATTKYLNDKWKEHEIDIEVEIESSTLEVSVAVKDKSDENSYFDMADRSQGFKQFISLLLSISISSVSGDTKDHLILIDEPEVHLHPSGVRWMLKELIEIGKHNYLFISTHSNFMLDKEAKERHYLLTKGKDCLTEVRHITSDEDINDDEVIQSAFGISVITDFLTEHKLLVEGATDKKLLQKSLKYIKPDHDVLITNGTGANIVAVASYLLLNKVNTLVIVDDDKAGKEAKSKILKIDDAFTNNTHTIRDLDGNITDGGTIEDTLPKDFVESKTREALRAHGINEAITLDDTKPYCIQIVDFYNQETSSDTATTQKTKKTKLNALLTDIKVKVSEYQPTKKFQEDAPRLYAISEKILKKFGIS